MDPMNWLILLALGALLLLALSRRVRKQKKHRGAKVAAAALPTDAAVDAVDESRATVFTEDVEDNKALAKPSPVYPQVSTEAMVQESAQENAGQFDNETGAALLREVFTARLQALAATTRLKLESLDGKAGTGAESDLLHKQLHLLNERTANLETSYQEELACHEETARFLARLATSRPESQAGQIRHILLHKASTREAEAFLDQFSQEPQNKPTLTAQAAVLSARLAEQRIDLPLALSRYTRALRIFPDNIEYLRLAGDLAHLLGQYEPAARWQQSRVRLIKRQPGHSAVSLALAERDLAYTSLKARRFDQAAPLYKSAMTALSEALGNNHPEMAQGWFQLGEMQESQGAYDKAQGLYRRALDILESNLGRLDLQLGPVLNKLATLAMDMRLEKEALAHYQHLAAIQERYLPQDHPFLAGTWAALARAYLLRGEYALAEQYCLKSLASNENLHGHEHPVVADLMKELSHLSRQQGRPEEADQYHREAETIRTQLGQNRAGTAVVQDAAPAAEQ